MEILNVRIDERLVHGMVATFWIPKLQVDRVICADDVSSMNQVVKNALRMATPKNVFLSVITAEKAIENLKSGKYGNEKIMIVAKTPDIIWRMIESGVNIPEVTLGNLGIINRAADSVLVNKYLAVTPSDKTVFEQIHGKGTKLTIQLIPDEVPTDFYSTMIEKTK